VFLLFILSFLNPKTRQTCSFRKSLERHQLLMKKAFVMIALSFVTVSLSMAQSKDAEVKIKTSAVCKMCKKTIETALTYEKGVKASNLDVNSKVLTVSYNPKKTNPDQLRKAVAKAGYDADEVPAEQKAYNQLEDCCKKEAKQEDHSNHH